MVPKNSLKKINSITDLTPDKKNSREHNARNVSMIMDSIGEVGVSRSGVIDEDGNILAGNGTYQALGELGLKKIKVVKAAGDEWVVVQRDDLSEEDKVKVSLYDNRTAELATWDPAILQEMNEDDPEFMSRLFSAEELDSVFDLIAKDKGPMEGEDDVPDVPNKAKTKPGQVYRLGEQRLMCGDSADPAQVQTLMDGETADMVFTDPPYGIDIVNKDMVGKTSKLGFSGSDAVVKAKKYRPIIGDDKPFDPKFMLSLAEKIILWGANNYSSQLPDMPQWLVWDKKDGSGSDHNNFSDCELAWTNFKGKAIRVYRYMWSGLLRKGPRDLELKERVHPTQKPVGLFIHILGDFTETNELILDLYGGSGSTMIACEKLNRKCYMMEIDPLYCDVIIDRYKKLFPENEVKKLTNGSE